ncbi:MAG: periplasmic divalent cation tolerance protein [Phormidesmis priestleyi Ana]|uniref:Periplasmic divalent cation tolerance protein n=1 Tax=Phormidesmis priestleyi Ana TaxID=1666911 RepID=A0A0P7YZQ1_9CYAN|nr:MAG: periplasmic divalent cation tolerance protein [Phormidesmis priestleyi Ana]
MNESNLESNLNNERASSAYCIVMTTASTEAEADKIAAALVEAQLAACVNSFAIKSVYTWQGSLQREAEWQLVIKTRCDCFEAVSTKICSLHSYETPEVIALPIQAGAADYLSWLGAQVLAS